MVGTGAARGQAHVQAPQAWQEALQESHQLRVAAAPRLGSDEGAAEAQLQGLQVGAVLRHSCDQPHQRPAVKARQLQRWPAGGRLPLSTCWLPAAGA
jgi:hypothetical protein